MSPELRGWGATTNRTRNPKLLISTAPPRAKSREPAYSQALIQTKSIGIGSDPESQACSPLLSASYLMIALFIGALFNAPFLTAPFYGALIKGYHRSEGERRMYASMYGCMYVCLYVCMHAVCMFALLHAFICACMYARMHACTHVCSLCSKFFKVCNIQYRTVSDMSTQFANRIITYVEGRIIRTSDRMNC